MAERSKALCSGFLSIAVRKGVGSNPTLVIKLLLFFSSTLLVTSYHPFCLLFVFGSFTWMRDVGLGDAEIECTHILKLGKDIDGGSWVVINMFNFPLSSDFMGLDSNITIFTYN